MPQSLSKICLHTIFSTKNRRDIIDQNIESHLHTFVAGILINIDCTPMKIGGNSNHIHILNTFPGVISISKIIETIKKGNKYNNFHWQNGYGVFSVSKSQVFTVSKYIARQKEHHQKLPFQQEYRKFLENYDIDYNEKYVLAWIIHNHFKMVG